MHQTNFAKNQRPCALNPGGRGGGGGARGFGGGGGFDGGGFGGGGCGLPEAVLPSNQPMNPVQALTSTVRAFTSAIKNYSEILAWYRNIVICFPMLIALHGKKLQKPSPKEVILELEDMVHSICQEYSGYWFDKVEWSSLV